MLSRIVRAVCVIVIVAVASPARAQGSAPAARFGVSATVGVSMPVDSAMSDVYGSRLVPVTGQIDVRIDPAISLFGGVRWMKADGRTVIVGTPVAANESYATSFRMTSFRLGALVSAHIVPRWVLAGGAGICIASYEEQWPDAAQSVKDRGAGFLALAEARYALNARWGVVARLEYASIPQSNTVANTSANLGGLDGSAGVRFVF